MGMRLFLVGLIIWLGGLELGQARLGDSAEKLLERFGVPEQQAPAGVGDLKQHVYFNKDLMITVLLTGNESVMEQYVRLKERPKEGQKPYILPIPEALAQAILKANQGDSSWEPYQSSPELRRFVRKDQKGFASFNMNKGMITELRVSSKDMVDFALKLRSR